MLKHIITKECNRKCSYCISKSITQEQLNSITRIDQAYNKCRQDNRSIMLTGGEPTMAYGFKSIVELAKSWFPDVYIVTQNPKALTDNFYRKFRAITFSMHDNKAKKLVVLNGTTVYASIMSHLYTPLLPGLLASNGFSGLTVNENQRDISHAFDNSNMPFIPNFSIRVNRIGKCLDETFIMPDLSVVHGYKEYL